MFGFCISKKSTLFLWLFTFIAVAMATNLGDHEIHANSADLELNYLFTGDFAKYYVSSAAADIITAETTCHAKNKTLQLLSIENDIKFHEILPYLQRSIGVDGVWTSGIETTFKDSRDLFWTSTALPLDYAQFAPTLQQLLTGDIQERQRRSVHGVSPPCSCNNECTERPSCSYGHNCTVVEETCEVEQPTCTEPTNQDCYLLEPEPTCTVTCPDCVLQRGKCVLVQPVCKVKEGTPECHTSRRGNCTVIPPKYEVIPGKCTAIQQPCIVNSPPTPCNRPINCSCQYNPGCGSDGDAPPTFGGNSRVTSYLNAPRNCSICPPGQPCPNSCPTDDKCYRVYNCVPDIICQPPPIACPPPIQHCLPAQLIKTSEETLACDEPQTTCTPPIVECTDVQKICEEDIITCPPPQTVCTPAVSHCPRPDYTCTAPVVECQDPSIDCPPFPSCQTPPICYGSKGYSSGRDGCKCREKREIYDQGKLIATKCIALKKSLGYNWALEECNNQNYFICEESLH